MDTLELKEAELQLLTEDIKLMKKRIKDLEKLDKVNDSNVQLEINELEKNIKTNEKEIQKWSLILENILKLQKEIRDLNSKNVELSDHEFAIKNELEKYFRILSGEE